MITLKDRVKSYSQMSEAYLSAAETVIASDLHSTTEFLFVGPITQLLGHATELALKAQLLRYMEEEDVKAFNHNLGAAALALSKKSDILTLA